MKIYVIDTPTPKKVERNYPCLLQGISSGNVYLATSGSTGILCSKCGGCREVGDVLEQFNFHRNSSYMPYKGTVTFTEE
ncbi:MAG: hypothetical protein KAS32_28980 [Candidatus Peribacteraceae bacterium]|nr:hypothetical protein [Candidatus Peribacteraceae bacterium]